MKTYKLVLKNGHKRIVHAESEEDVARNIAIGVYASTHRRGASHKIAPQDVEDIIEVLE